MGLFSPARHYITFASRYKRPGKPNLIIPMHRTVAPFLLLNQIRRAGIAEDEFLHLLR